jgi:hypothetical protein
MVAPLVAARRLRASFLQRNTEGRTLREDGPRSLGDAFE